MIFHENRLPADDSHEISCLICYFLKKQQNLKLSSAAKYRWRFMGSLIGLLGQARCLIVSIPDLCSLSDFKTSLCVGASIAYLFTQRGTCMCPFYPYPYRTKHQVELMLSDLKLF